MLECKLETGRTHQIRVHLSAIGHAVVGDASYRGYRESIPLTRPFLHARVLGFEHPVSGEWREFENALPHELVAARSQHTKQIDDLSVQVVVNLGVALGLVHEN